MNCTMKSLVLSLVFFHLHVSVIQADVVLFGFDDGADQLLKINAATGAATAVGSTGIGLFIGLEAADDGTLYVVNSTTDQLFTIDQQTATANVVGSFGGGFVGMQDLAFNSSGVLYGFEDATNDLVTIDLNTGTATTVVRLPNTNLTGLAFDSSDNLYASDFIDGKLFEVNQITGALTEIGSFGLSASHHLATLDFDASGTLYAADFGITDHLYTINTSTGAATSVGPTGFGTVRGIVFANSSVPEPSSFVLLSLLGFAGIAAKRTKRTCTI